MSIARTTLLLTALVCLSYVAAEPSYFNLDVSDRLSICVQNCAQCVKMYGAWFAGERCAEACRLTKGGLYPDCDNRDAVRPFINRLNLID